MGGKYTEAQKNATLKHAKSKLKRVPLDMKKTDYEQLAEAAKKSGLPVNTYIKQAIAEKMLKESQNQK